MSFDPIGTVVDWLDACKAGEVGMLIELYHPHALHTCGGNRAQGHAELRIYLERQLAGRHPEAFKLSDVALKSRQVMLDYLNFDGTPARSQFEFDEAGKIVSLSCVCGTTGSCEQAVKPALAPQR